MCRGDLSEAENLGKRILRCADCGAEYSVEDGIPVLFPNEKYSPNIHKRYWDAEKEAKSYAEKYDRYLKNEGHPWKLYTHISELRAIERLIKRVKINIKEKTLLDCGCGNGRLFSIFPEAGVKIGIDTSLYLLQATKKRNPGLWLVCGQLEDMPFKDCIADLSVSIRVFQHLKAPEHAFSEMTRVTHPSGHIALELYNKYNPKELYKRVCMLPMVSKIKPWGLAYDRYYSYREINNWCRANFVKPLAYAGAGWGLHFYFFDLIKFKRFAPFWLQRTVFNLFLFLENIVGGRLFFSKTLEKICFIGSMQSETRKRNILKKIKNRVYINKDIKAAEKFEMILNDRNYSFVGTDDHHLRLTIDWLKKAQDQTADAGVSRGFSLVRGDKSNGQGWQPSYPETTGYIMPTIIEAGKILSDSDLSRRAKLMADWEMRIMFSDGAVHGGNICSRPNRAVFDTGQVIRGLHAVYKETNQEKYLAAAIKSAKWILKSENDNKGNWVDNNASCVSRDTTAYNIYAVAPIIKLGLEINNNDFKELGMRAGNFTLEKQNKNGWFKDADFEDRSDYLTHTIAYTIDGLWETGELLNEEKFIISAKRALDGILPQIGETGKLPGRLNGEWQGTVNWVCLTGAAQIGIICIKAFQKYNDEKYFQAAFKIKEFLKTCQNNIDDNHGGLGAVWGSWPISGGYGRYQALNWSAKYFADLLILFIALNSEIANNPR